MSVFLTGIEGATGVNKNDLAFGSSFPYIALPNSGSGNRNNVGSAPGGSTPANNNNSNSGGNSSGRSATPTGGVGAGFGGTAGGGGIPTAPLGAALAGLVLTGAASVLLWRNRRQTR